MIGNKYQNRKAGPRKEFHHSALHNSIHYGQGVLLPTTLDWALIELPGNCVASRRMHGCISSAESSQTDSAASSGPIYIYILPWYVRIREDHSTLDTPDSGTWEEVSAGYRDLVQAARTPLGFTSSKYGRLPYAFPAAVRFHGAGLISDCLVGRS
jgi:hypothetical protein